MFLKKILLFLGMAICFLQVAHSFEYRKTLDMEVLDVMKSIKTFKGTLDWYKIFNLTSDANKKDIIRAYRTYSRNNHPDKLDIKGEEYDRLVAEYESLGSAVGILKDDILRPRYDYFRTRGIPIWDRKTKLSRFGIYYGFYIWWYQVYMAPFVLLLLWATGDYIFQIIYYNLAQNALVNGKKVDRFPPSDQIIPVKGNSTIKELEVQLDRVKKLDRFKVLFLFEDPASVPKASFDRIVLVRFLKKQLLTKTNKKVD
ncbi:hypothetical protein BB560_003750 [Smittium megazygosporum]|uniref:J domain-containing protein n=1 Tax=Smittium megazygosporum TaxID=133381 RepID=A0A2T9ZB60_9FUNG|nr:hypothetical protein BB560_003750 [Smittium megazygosporum]